MWAAHGKLIHLAAWSRPDLAHAVSVLGRYVHNPSQKLWYAYHHIAKYLIRTKDFHLSVHRRLFAPISSWSRRLLQLEGQTQHSAAEYYALSTGTKQALNLLFVLRDLGFGQSLPTTLFCDNRGAITMTLLPANKPASRHIDMRIHFCCKHVELGDVNVTACTPTPDMVADFMTRQTQIITHESHCRRAFGN